LGEEGLRAGDECGVVVEAGVAAAFVVVESELAFELPVVELDLPAQSGEPCQPLARLVVWEVGEPVVGWRLGALGPFEDQPLPARRQTVGAEWPSDAAADPRTTPRAGRAANQAASCPAHRPRAG